MAALSITAASVLASSSATVLNNYKFGATVTQGQAVYLDPTLSTWKLLDSDVAAGNEATTIRGIALNAGSSGQPAHVCIKDSDFTPGCTLTNGLTVYPFTTAGAISQADVPTTGSYSGNFGNAKSTTKMVLNPSFTGAII